MTYVNRFETPTTITGTPSLRTVLSYDDANRLEAITHRAALHEVSAPVLNDYNFVYDDASRIQSIDSLLDGLSVFTFSTDNQLTDADHDPSRDDENYSYDANGNRVGRSYVVDAQNRTTSDGTYDYEFDDEGNRTKRTLVADGSYEVNTFDHRNRLTKVEFFTAAGVLQQAVVYTYDAFNNLVRRTVDTDGNGTDDLDQIFAGFDRNQSTFEFDGSETSNLTHRRLWGPLVDQLIASEEVDSLTTPGDVLWALFDQVGTIRDIGQFDPTAGTAGEYEIVSHRVYNSFGVLTDEYDPDTQSPSNVDLDFGFTGKFTDELTGLTHHQHRWLDPQLGKWINEDPIGLFAGDVNTTRYVANDPLMYNDPTGLFASNMGSFGGANGSSGHGGGDGDGIKAYEGYDDEVPALFRFIHWCLGTTPDSIKSKNRAEHGRVCRELSNPNGDRRVNQSTLSRSRDASALDAELMRQLGETAVNHNASAGFYAAGAHGAAINNARRTQRHQTPVLTNHARERMAQRNVTIARVQEAIDIGSQTNNGTTATFNISPGNSSSGRGLTVIQDLRTRNVITVIDRGSQR